MTDFPTGEAIIDQNRSGLIGKAVDRVDGWAKVTGAAQYSYEITEAGEALVGVIVGAAIARGQVAAVDVAAALASPGVVHVMTHENAPPQAPFCHPPEAANRLWCAKPFLNSDEVRCFGDPVALVVADSFENARAAAALIRVGYVAEHADLAFEEGLSGAYMPDAPSAKVDVGDFEGAFAQAEVQLDETYTTPIQQHAQMEPHASLAVWEGDKVTVFTACQLLKSTQRSLAETLMIPRDDVRIVARYVGGGFGGKLHVSADATLAALAARVLGRPVKVQLTRAQMFAISTHRSASRQRIRLGADKDGRLTALAHEGVMHCARFFEFTEPVSNQTKPLYAAANRRFRHELVKLDIPMADAVRAPGEAIGMLAVEAAMDELAHRLGIDPIELRVRNEPNVDPTTGKPYSSRSLVACMREGAARFGWDRRNTQPGQVRDGRFLVGLGMSAAIRSNYLMPARATIGLNVEGVATIRQAMTDIGTGTYTILAQVAAEALGLKVADIRVDIGDSEFPPAPGSGGSFGAASAASAVLDAAMNLRRAAAKLAVGDPDSPLFGADPTEPIFAEGAILIGNRAIKLTELLSRTAPEGLTAMGRVEVPAEYNDYSQHAHGAHFCEVGVDPLTGEIRLRRMLGVFAAGRILNEKTARSQAIGGMIWGVGGALMEENHPDPRFGSFVAQDLAGYHVPAHADIVDLDAMFIAEQEDRANPLKIKGVGELGICGAGAAVANAVFNACGIRLRDYPLTLDKVLAALPDAP